MKKVLFLSTLIAAVLLASSCQKEQELVTLGAVISQTGKTYIDDRYPCWNNGDQVYVNNAAYPISAASGPSAQIADVVSADGYRALFPASLVPANMDITNSSSIPVTLPATQLYTLVDGHQRVNAPMGAYIEGEVLQFHNLCSIVHVVVNNNTGSDMALDKLRIAADNAYLSGAGTATVTGADDDGITLSSEASHSVTLRIAGPTSVTLAAGAQSAFDLYVPAFPTDNVTITLYYISNADLSKNSGFNYNFPFYFELTKTDVALTPNTYTTVSLNVTSLTSIPTARLCSGSAFNAAIPDNTTAVVFEYNSSASSGTLLSSWGDAPIYGNLDGTIWRVSTSASMIIADPDCSGMFSNIYNSTTNQFESSLERIDFGEGFNTTNVTDMSYMFGNCSSLTNLDLSNFNTENVTDMYGMFTSCSGLTSLDLSSFNTANVTNMSWMFGDCSSLTSLDLSNFNTANVTDMYCMFARCSSLTNLDLSSFNTENVAGMGSMFGDCSSLTSLDVSNFNTENVTDMHTMFAYCSGLTSLDLSNFNTENVTGMSSMFYGCGSLTSLDLSNYNTMNVTNMHSMFGECSSLTSLDLSHFDMSNTTNKTDMCYHLSTTSGHCTIICPAAVQTELENGTHLPTWVTFTWVRPTSK